MHDINVIELIQEVKEMFQVNRKICLLARNLKSGGLFRLIPMWRG